MKEKLEQEKRLNLKNDVIFKTFFSRKGNEEFLIDFLNALLKIEIKKIQIREEANLEKIQPEEKGRKVRHTSRAKWWNNNKYRNASKK